MSDMQEARPRPHEDLHVRLSLVRADLERAAGEMESLRSKLEESQRSVVDRRQLLTNSMLARMRARLETLPTIEQAKGILMARSGCSPEEAFDMLRQASQRTNVPVRQVAQEIVGRATARRRQEPSKKSELAAGR